MATDNDDSLRIILIVIGAIVFLPVVFGLLMVPMMGMMGAWWVGGDGGPTGWLLLWQVVPLLLLVAAAALGLRWLRGRELGGDPALQELRHAYARGDIDDEEFERRRAVLEDDTD